MTSAGEMWTEPRSIPAVELWCDGLQRGTLIASRVPAAGAARSRPGNGRTWWFSANPPHDVKNTRRIPALDVLLAEAERAAET